MSVDGTGKSAAEELAEAVARYRERMRSEGVPAMDAEALIGRAQAFAERSGIGEAALALEQAGTGPDGLSVTRDGDRVRVEADGRIVFELALDGGGPGVVQALDLGDAGWVQSLVERAAALESVPDAARAKWAARINLGEDADELARAAPRAGSRKAQPLEKTLQRLIDDPLLGEDTRADMRDYLREFADGRLDPADADFVRAFDARWSKSRGKAG